MRRSAGPACVASLAPRTGILRADGTLSFLAIWALPPTHGDTPQISFVLAEAFAFLRHRRRWVEATVAQ